MKTLLNSLAALTLMACSLPAIVVPTNSDFTVNYDAIGGTSSSVITGLTSKIRFYNFSFSPGTTNQSFTRAGNGNTTETITFNGTGLTNLKFNVDFTPTWAAAFNTTRITAFGFATDPNVVSSVTAATIDGKAPKKTTLVNPNDFDPNNIFGSSVVCVSNGSGCTTPQPNSVPTVEVCFIDNNNGCGGGGNGGINTNTGITTTGSVSLWFSGSVSEVNFTNFYVRYQSIPGAITSAVGRQFQPPLPPTSVVPEPSFYGVLAAGFGALGLAYRRRLRS